MFLSVARTLNKKYYLICDYIYNGSIFINAV